MLYRNPLVTRDDICRIRIVSIQIFSISDSRIMSQTHEPLEYIEKDGEKIECTEQEKLDFVIFLNQNSIQDYTIKDAKYWLDQKRAGTEPITFGIGSITTEQIPEPVTTAIVPYSAPIQEPVPDYSEAAKEAEQLINPEAVQLVPDNDLAENERAERWNQELTEPGPNEQKADQEAEEEEAVEEEEEAEEPEENEEEPVKNHVKSLGEKRKEREEREAKEREEKQLAEALPKVPGLDFTASYSDLDQFKKIIAAAREIVEELTFEVDNEAVTFRVMDPSHVALIDARIDAKSFRKFDCKNKGNFTLRMDDFGKILNRGKKEMLNLSIDGEEGLKIDLVGRRTKGYVLHLIESSQSGTPIPKNKYSTHFAIPAKELEEIISDINITSNVVRLTAYHDHILFSGKGDTGKFGTEL